MKALLQADAAMQQAQHLTDSIGNGDAAAVQSAWQQMLRERWKPRGLSARIPGLPPAFARKPGCSTDPAVLVATARGEGADWRGAKAWRRKLLHFPSDGCRPPLYGSFSRHRCANVSTARAWPDYLVSCTANLAPSHTPHNRRSMRR